MMLIEPDSSIDTEVELVRRRTRLRRGDTDPTALTGLAHRPHHGKSLGKLVGPQVNTCGHIFDAAVLPLAHPQMDHPVARCSRFRMTIHNLVRMTLSTGLSPSTAVLSPRIWPVISKGRESPGSLQDQHK